MAYQNACRSDWRCCKYTACAICIIIQVADFFRTAPAGNVYAVAKRYSDDVWLKISIFLMILHQAIAFAIYFLPLAFIWEKLIGVHTKPMWIRSFARLPVCEYSFYVSVLAVLPAARCMPLVTSCAGS